MLLTWLPEVLARAGIKVVLTPGWLTRSHGELPEDFDTVWHHDASPPGDSPGALDWMIANWDEASAPVWVDRAGVWYLVGCGVAWHAGKVLPGMPGNFDSIAFETDHTTGEAWPAVQLDSMRRGTAAIFVARNRPASSLHFHKTICDPPGRKSDPDGLDLDTERAAVAALMGTVIEVKPAPPQTNPSEEDIVTPQDKEDIAALVVEKLLATKIEGQDTTLKPISTTVKGALVQIFSIGRGNSRIGARTKAIAKKVGLK